MKLRIDVYTAGAGYVADFAQALFGSEIEAAFGDTVLPLPFTLVSAVDSVVSHLERLNPGHDVVFCGERVGR